MIGCENVARSTAWCQQRTFIESPSRERAIQRQRSISSVNNARNYTQCDSLLIGEKCGAHTVPYIEVRNPTARVEHEATTSKISDDQMFYCHQRGLAREDALSLIVNGFCKEVLKQLPMEFAVEAQKLLAISLEGSVG
jgi:Fe-S cluster assembly protein SufB